MTAGIAVLAVTVVLLAASVGLVAQLRSIEADRGAGKRTIAVRLGATATRVVYSILVVTAFAILPMAWALGALPTAGLFPYLTSPLAIRLGDTVSHRSGRSLDGALREAVVLLVAFDALLGLSLALA